MHEAHRIHNPILVEDEDVDPTNMVVMVTKDKVTRVTMVTIVVAMAEVEVMVTTRATTTRKETPGQGLHISTEIRHSRGQMRIATNFVCILKSQNV